MIKDVVLNSMKREIRKPTVGRYYPSVICSSCIRKTWFDFKFPKAFPVETVGIFESGTKIHEFVQKIVAKSNIISEEEVPIEMHFFNGLFKVRGKIDNVIEYNNQKIIIEYKSTADISKILCPKDEHLTQINLYLGMRDLKNGMIVYIDKQNYSKIKEFSITFDKKIYDDTISNIKLLHEHIIEDKLPEKTKTKSCNWCIHKDLCFATDMN